MAVPNDIRAGKDVRYIAAWPSTFRSDVIAISPNCRGGTRQSAGL